MSTDIERLHFIIHSKSDTIQADSLKVRGNNKDIHPMIMENLLVNDEEWDSHLSLNSLKIGITLKELENNLNLLKSKQSLKNP